MTTENTTNAIPTRSSQIPIITELKTATFGKNESKIALPQDTKTEHRSSDHNHDTTPPFPKNLNDREFELVMKGLMQLFETKPKEVLEKQKKTKPIIDQQTKENSVAFKQELLAQEQKKSSPLSHLKMRFEKAKPEINTVRASDNLINAFSKSTFAPVTFLKHAYVLNNLGDPGLDIQEAMSRANYNQMLAIEKTLNTAQFVNLYLTVKKLALANETPHRDCWVGIAQVMDTLKTKVHHVIDSVESSQDDFREPGLHKPIKTIDDVLPSNRMAINKFHNWIEKYDKAFESKFGNKLRELEYQDAVNEMKKKQASQSKLK